MSIEGEVVAASPEPYRLVSVVAPFVAVTVLLVGLATASADILTGIRAFVAGESRWSSGEKSATFFLARYAIERDPADYQRFLRHIAVPLGDHKARLELLRDEPDIERVRQGFIEGGNHPDDIDGMIRLFRRFGEFGPMAQAVAIWTRADDYILEMADVGAQIHELVGNPTADPARLQVLAQRISTISDELTRLESAFSDALGEASRMTETVLWWALPALATILLLLAAMLSRLMLRHHAQVTRALRTSQERLWLAFQGRFDGLWDWDLRSGSAHYSPRVGAMLGVDAGRLTPYWRDFRSIVHPDDIAPTRRALAAHLRHGHPYLVELRLLTGSGQYRWFQSTGTAVRDANERPVRIAGAILDVDDRRHAEAAARRQAHQQHLIAEFGQAALRNPEVGELIEQAVQVVRQGMHCDSCRVLSATSDKDTLVYSAGFGWTEGWVSRRTLDAATEIGDRFVPGPRESVIVDDYLTETRFPCPPMLLSHGVRSAVEMLVSGNHGFHGVLGVYMRRTAAFDASSLPFLRGITHVLASAMDRKVVDDQLNYMARFDRLTDLPNRTLYMDRLWQSIAHAERRQQTLGVLFVDLDRFKQINDSMGHDAGDAVLLQVARRLKESVRAGDTVARLGGDEFTVALVGLARADDATAVARKIIDAMARPVAVQGRDVYVSASIGISIFPTDGHDPETLLKNADTAMYQAKSRGRNTYQFFQAQMNAQAQARLAIQTELRGALERREFVLHYQPKVELHGGTICGFEALLRWQHPTRGLVMPGEFIAELEDTGLIEAVGNWVVSTVCQQLRVWQDAGVPVVPVAVNLSARQFGNLDLERDIAGAIAATGIRPDLLELELTESALMSDPAASAQTLKNLRARGLRVSVDDFGTGYSSLAYLKRFPLQSLKIDRAFIHDVGSDADDTAIVVAIIQLAHSLKLSVVAEGVETETQLRFLLAHGCDAIQGYLFSRPQAIEPATRDLALGRRLALPRKARADGVGSADIDAQTQA